MSDYTYDEMVEEENFKRKFSRPYDKSLRTSTEKFEEKGVEYFFTSETGRDLCAYATIYATIDYYDNNEKDPQWQESGSVLSSIGYKDIEFQDEEGNEIQYSFTSKEEEDFKDFIYEYLNIGNYVD